MGNDVAPTSAAMLRAESGAREAMSSIAVKARHQQTRHRIRQVGPIASRYCQWSRADIRAKPPARVSVEHV